MVNKAATPRYDLVARLLHWAIAVLILGLVGLGWWMVDLSYYERWYNRSLEWHKALGILVLELALLNIAWNLARRPPPLPGSIPRWQRIAAHAVHGVLFLLMLGIPLTGYLISTSAGAPVSFFGLYEVPALFDGGTRVRDIAIDLHYWMSYGALALVAMHAGAALKHQFIDKDGTLRRMLW